MRWRYYCEIKTLFTDRDQRSLLGNLERRSCLQAEIACLEPKEGRDSAILYIMLCIYTGMYGPNTVDTPHDRTFQSRYGRQKSSADHTCTVGRPGYFGSKLLLINGWTNTSSSFHFGLEYRKLTRQWHGG